MVDPPTSGHPRARSASPAFQEMREEATLQHTSEKKRLKLALWRYLDPEGTGSCDLLTLTVFFHVLMGAVDEETFRNINEGGATDVAVMSSDSVGGRKVGWTSTEAGGRSAGAASTEAGAPFHFNSDERTPRSRRLDVSGELSPHSSVARKIQMLVNRFEPARLRAEFSLLSAEYSCGVSTFFTRIVPGRRRFGRRGGHVHRFREKRCALRAGGIAARGVLGRREGGREAEGRGAGDSAQRAARKGGCCGILSNGDTWTKQSRPVAGVSHRCVRSPLLVENVDIRHVYYRASSWLNLYFSRMHFGMSQGGSVPHSSVVGSFGAPRETVPSSSQHREGNGGQHVPPSSSQHREGNGGAHTAHGAHVLIGPHHIAHGHVAGHAPIVHGHVAGAPGPRDAPQQRARQLQDRAIGKLRKSYWMDSEHGGNARAGGNVGANGVTMTHADLLIWRQQKNMEKLEHKRKKLQAKKEKECRRRGRWSWLFWVGLVGIGGIGLWSNLCDEKNFLWRVSVICTAPASQPV